MTPNILIVDDLEYNLILLQSIMKKTDANIIRASSGSEALEKTRGVELALAIIDVMMPLMSGYELAIKLNEERIDEKVPVIFLTAQDGNETEIFKGYDSGAIDYIIKPLNNEILISKINVFLDLFNQKQTIIRNMASLKVFADELVKMNDALKKSEAKYRSYIDNAPDGIFITDETGKFIEVNDAACTMTGYSKSELLTRSLSDIVQKKQTAAGQNFFENLLNAGKIKTNLRCLPKNGSKRWWAFEAVKLSEARFLCFTFDITDQKRTELELQRSIGQLHNLTQNIEKVREEERVAISRELHDELGQALTAVKIDLELIKHGMADSESISKINKVSELVRETINTVQRLTAQLRPQIIEDIGLEAAIEWYTSEFAQRNKIDVLLHIESGISISQKASLAVFRIMQESLTNISRHARASQINIWLRKTGDKIHFTISDNGIGIPENKIKSGKSFGILGMKERAASLGGTFKIYRANENGTEIKIIFPLNYSQKHENFNLR